MNNKLFSLLMALAGASIILVVDHPKAWVVSAMGEEAVAELAASLDAQIEAQKNPTTETKTIAD